MVFSLTGVPQLCRRQPPAFTTSLHRVRPVVSKGDEILPTGLTDRKVPYSICCREAT